MNYVEKLTLFGHIPWEYLGLPLNFSADPLTYLWSKFYLIDLFHLLLWIHSFLDVFYAEYINLGTSQLFWLKIRNWLQNHRAIL